MNNRSLLYFNIIVLFFDICILKLFILPMVAIVLLLIGMAFNTTSFFICVIKLYRKHIYDNELDTH